MEHNSHWQGLSSDPYFTTFTKHPNKRKTSLFSRASVDWVWTDRKGVLLKTRQNGDKVGAFHTISLYVDVFRTAGDLTEATKFLSRYFLHAQSLRYLSRSSRRPGVNSRWGGNFHFSTVMPISALGSIQYQGLFPRVVEAETWNWP